MRQGGRRPKVPASLADIDLDRVRRALFKAEGNVTRAAKSLKVPSSDLRRLTWRHPTLIMDALEEAHCLVDRAESKLREVLYSDHPERSLRAATFILSHHRAATFILSHHRAARERGWSRHGGAPFDGVYSLPRAAGPTVAMWAGDSLGYRPLEPATPEARRLEADGPEDGRRY
jgi:hypothetical protein